MVKVNMDVDLVWIKASFDIAFRHYILVEKRNLSVFFRPIRDEISLM